MLILSHIVAFLAGAIAVLLLLSWLGSHPHDRDGGPPEGR